MSLPKPCPIKVDLKAPSKASIRGALTTLKKAGVIFTSDFQGDDFIKGKISILIRVDSELTQPKKTIRKRKKL